jgi:hypothetical protein
MRELESDRDVMVNVHSTYHRPSLVLTSKADQNPGWGGLPVCSALVGLSRDEREKEERRLL